MTGQRGHVSESYLVTKGDIQRGHYIKAYVPFKGDKGHEHYIEVLYPLPSRLATDAGEED